MYVTRTKKSIKNFYLDKSDDRVEYEKLINDPSVNILDKSFFSESSTDFDGESSTTTERPCVRVEWELCSL